MDKNTPEAKQYQFANIGGPWVSLGNKGAMMVRPVVGSFTPSSTPIEEITKGELDFNLYPNPSKGIINIDFGSADLLDFEVSVFNAVGQLLVKHPLQTAQLDLSAFENGIYYIRIKNLQTNQFTTHKVAIFKD